MELRSLALCGPCTILLLDSLANALLEVHANADTDEDVAVDGDVLGRGEERKWRARLEMCWKGRVKGRRVRGARANIFPFIRVYWPTFLFRRGAMG